MLFHKRFTFIVLLPNMPVITRSQTNITEKFDDKLSFINELKNTIVQCNSSKEKVNKIKYLLKVFDIFENNITNRIVSDGLNTYINLISAFYLKTTELINNNIYGVFTESRKTHDKLVNALFSCVYRIRPFTRDIILYYEQPNSSKLYIRAKEHIHRLDLDPPLSTLSKKRPIVNVK